VLLDVTWEWHRDEAEVDILMPLLARAFRNMKNLEILCVPPVFSLYSQVLDGCHFPLLCRFESEELFPVPFLHRHAATLTHVSLGHILTEDENDVPRLARIQHICVSELLASRLLEHAAPTTIVLRDFSTDDIVRHPNVPSAKTLILELCYPVSLMICVLKSNLYPLILSVLV
jgi:hypothetical protein